MYTHAAAALVAGVLAFAGAWQVQGWRLGGQLAQLKAAQADALATATREARAAESKRFLTVKEAQDAATQRARSARLDADAARSELDRLRDATRATAGGVPGDSPGACTQRADAAGELLAVCAASYQELARAADAHANDARTLSEAWPR